MLTRMELCHGLRLAETEAVKNQVSYGRSCQQQISLLWSIQKQLAMEHFFMHLCTAKTKYNLLKCCL